MTIRVAVLLLASIQAVAQDATPLERQVMIRLKAALAPGISAFPLTDASGDMPLNGNTEALWMVRLPQEGERTIELLANPLNEVNQAKATRAMALIERSIEAAQRRATAQYERAVAEAKRTGRSQEVDGVTLSDEGIEGAKIDAESHVSIEVAFNEPAYRFSIAGDAQPVLTTLHSGTVTMIAFPSSTYRDDAVNADRYVEAETIVLMGRIAAPQVTKRGDHSYEVLATTTPVEGTGLNTLVVRFRGNEALVKELPLKTAWTPLLELLK
jgi:hypothetical protein